jgi:hypothetical protein
VPSASCSFALKSADREKKRNQRRERPIDGDWLHFLPNLLRLLFFRVHRSVALLRPLQRRCSSAVDCVGCKCFPVACWPRPSLQSPSADRSGLSGYSQLHQRCNRLPGPLIHPLVLICLMPVESRVTRPSDGVHLGPIAEGRYWTVYLWRAADAATCHLCMLRPPPCKSDVSNTSQPVQIYKNPIDVVLTLSDGSEYILVCNTSLHPMVFTPLIQFQLFFASLEQLSIKSKWLKLSMNVKYRRCVPMHVIPYRSNR